MKYISYIILAFLLMGCSDYEMPNQACDDISKATGSLGYTTDDLTRAGSFAADKGGNHVCWQDGKWNENAIYTLDVFLLSADNTVLAFYQKNALTDTPLSSNCNETHSLVQYKELPVSFNMTNFKAASKLVMVANYRPLISENDINLGVTNFNMVYKNHNLKKHDDYQDGFIMVGECAVSDDFDLSKDMIVSLKRLAVKIRVSLVDKAGNSISQDSFYSQLSHYAMESEVLAPSDIPAVKENDSDGILDYRSLYTTTVALYPNGASAFSYPDDITDSHSLVRDNGHVYYCYPSDWADYGKFSFKECTIDKHLTEPKKVDEPEPGSKNYDNNLIKYNQYLKTLAIYNEHVSSKNNRYFVKGYDDTAPINANREMYLIVKAQFEGKYYFYKVPTNYRFYTYNDRQCFSKDEIKEILSLYRAERNHFYDIVAKVDKAGAASPAQAASPAFTLTVLPLTAEAPLDYIY